MKFLSGMGRSLFYAGCPLSSVYKKAVPIDAKAVSSNPQIAGTSLCNLCYFPVGGDF
jgi:hypothetical protein